MHTTFETNKALANYYAHDVFRSAAPVKKKKKNLVARFLRILVLMSLEY